MVQHVLARAPETSHHLIKDENQVCLSQVLRMMENIRAGAQ
jgi:hypothetical protein